MELTPQVGGALWMQLNRNDARAGRDERASYRSSSGTDIENEIPGSDAGVYDDAARPTAMKLMPPPPWPAGRGHGGPSPRSTSWV
jgi:hypothetical protein